jgi:hypothetical protein
VKGLIPRFALGLLAVLVIAAILISLGQRETYARPSANSYNPSGLHALRELLSENGIASKIDRLEVPRIEPNDLVIAAYVESGPSMFGQDPLDPIEKQLDRHIRRGGRVMVLPFDEDFRARSLTAVKAATPIFSTSSKESLQVNSAPLTFGNLSEWGEEATSGSATFLPFEFEDDTYSPWFRRSSNSGEPFLTLALRGSGMFARFSDGMFATNRFIDRSDNAQIALRSIQGLLKDGGKVVFAEGTLGGAISPSLVDILGPWAAGIWVQLTVLFLVVIVTLGVRFGLPSQERRKQVGQREMVDAISDVYRRARSTSTAMDAVYNLADHRIRRGLKLPAHLTNVERDKFLPPSLVRLLQDVDLAKKPLIEVDSKGRQRISHRLSGSEALALAQNLEQELDAFVPKVPNRIS